MRKRVLAALLAAVLVLGLCPMGALADSVLTRAGLCVKIMEMTGGSYTPAAGEQSPYSDVAVSDPAYRAIRYCVAQRYVAAVGSGTFAPDRTLTRAEVAMILTRMGCTKPKWTFAWANDTKDHWAEEAIQNVMVLKLMEKDRENLFHPDDPALESDVDWAAAAAFWAIPILDDPTDLIWGKARGYRDQGDILHDLPGAMTWRVTGACQNAFQIDIYNVEAPDKSVFHAVHTFGSREQGLFSVEHFIVNSDDMENGTYFFTIQSLGDGENYRNSQTVRSGNWSYTKPRAAVAAPGAPVWDWPEYHWESPQDTTGIGGFYTEERFAQEGSGEFPEYGGGSWRLEAEDEEPILVLSDRIEDEDMERNGPGIYYVRVRSLSFDITRWNHSPWTDFVASDGSQSSGGYEATASKLQDIADAAGGDAEQIRSAVQAIGAEALREAMAMDLQGGAGVLDTLAQLEGAVGVDTGAVVNDPDNKLSDFDSGDVRVVGAALNDLYDGVTSVTLTVSPLEEETDLVISELYNDAITTKFSMDLDGVVNPHALEVPVLVTLPIPSNINPAFLVILHYHADGSVEAVERPYVYQSGGKWYADFLLDRFSDFAMTQAVNALVEVTLTAGKAKAQVQTDTDAQLVFAFYGQGNKLLRAEPVTAEAKAGSAVYTLNAPENAVNVRCFLLNEDGMVPLVEAKGSAD